MNSSKKKLVEIPTILKTFLYHFDVQGSYKVLPFLNKLKIRL